MRKQIRGCLTGALFYLALGAFACNGDDSGSVVDAGHAAGSDDGVTGGEDSAAVRDDTGGTPRTDLPEPAGTWTAALSVSNSQVSTGMGDLPSASRVVVSWKAALGSITSY